MATEAELTQAAWDAGFRGAEIPRIVAIAMAESGGQNNGPAGTAGPGEYSVGPLQINLSAHGSQISEAEARSTYGAMKYAEYLVHDTPQGWSHWSVYNNGSYKQFIPSDSFGGSGSTAMAGNCYTATGDSIDCALPGAVYDENFLPLTGTQKAGYQGATIPGLTFDPNTGQYKDASGRVLSQAEIDERISQADPQEAARLRETIRNNDRQIDAELRGQDISAATSRYGTDTSAQLSREGMAQNAYQFEQQQGLAKDQFLWQKQNDIANLEMRQKEYGLQAAQNARTYTLELQKMQFMENQFAFESAMSLRQEERATQAQIFSQQATVAGIQLEMVSIKQQAANLQAQLNQEVAIFNAAKAADVSMFNIDQQTRVAQFNSEMAFNVQQANAQEKRLRQQQLVDIASRLSEAGKDPGDRGALALMLEALGPGNFGGTDAAIANADLRTSDSVAPIESLLRTREDVQGQPDNPFSFTPVVAGQATFTPAQAATVPQPNFSGVQIPQVNTTPFNPASIPTKAPSVAPQTNDSYAQQYIATGATNTPDNQQFINTATGQPLTAEERAQIPQIALDEMINSGLLAHMEEGGLFNQGTTTPFSNFGSIQQDAQNRRPFDMQGFIQQLSQNFQNGQGEVGIPAGESPIIDIPSVSRPLTPFQDPSTEGGVGYREGSAPNRQTQQPRPANGQEFLSQLFARMAAEPRLAGMVERIQQAIPQLAGGNPYGGGQQGEGSTPFNAQPQQNVIPYAWDKFPQMMNRGGPGEHIPAAAQGGMMQGAFVAGEKEVANPEEIIIPLGPGQAMVIPPEQTQQMLKGGQAPQQGMADGGLFGPQAGQSMYEDLVGDMDRTRAFNFLNTAGERATRGTPYNINRLPTPVHFATPGTSRFTTDLGAALSALMRGVPPEYFKELVAQQRPVAYSEGVIGRSR